VRGEEQRRKRRKIARVELMPKKKGTLRRAGLHSAQVAAAAAEEGQLMSGAFVRIHSLQAANSQHYNGQECVLRTFNEERERWLVSVAGSEIWCKADNLEFLRAPCTPSAKAHKVRSYDEIIGRIGILSFSNPSVIKELLARLHHERASPEHQLVLTQVKGGQQPVTYETPGMLNFGLTPLLFGPSANFSLHGADLPPCEVQVLRDERMGMKDVKGQQWPGGLVSE